MHRSRLAGITVRRPGTPAANAQRVCAQAEPTGPLAGQRDIDVVWRVRDAERIAAPASARREPIAA